MAAVVVVTELTAADAIVGDVVADRLTLVAIRAAPAPPGDEICCCTDSD